MASDGNASEAEQAEAVARAVEAGTDGIELPAGMTDETSDDAAVVTAREQPESSTLYAQLLRMPMPEKVKLALRGNKEARALLMRDGSKMVRRYVLQNPRITEEEVVYLARDRQADEQMLQAIMIRREWMKLYQVRLALVRNPRTPLARSMRLLGTLMAKDVERIAKSRDVPQGVVTQARRMVLESRR